MRDKVEAVLIKVISEKVGLEIFIPEIEGQGHYSTNVAFRLARLEGKSALTIAGELAKKLKEAGGEFFERVEVGGTGFINFWISAKALRGELKRILKLKDKYGRGDKKNKKIQVEFVSANPTGPLTLANGRGGFLGDVLSNALEWNGFQVEREYYVNDTGNQIVALGKSAAAALDLIPAEDNFYKGDYVKEWAQKNASFVKKNKGNYLKIGQKAAAQFLKEIKTVLAKKAGIKFNRWTSEDKNIHRKGFVSRALKIFNSKKLTYKKDGALWLKTTAFGDDKDRVLITSDGFPTYFLADAGHYLETKSRGFDKKINILGPDHYGYRSRIQAAAEIIGLKDSEIIITQMVRLVSGGERMKMSKRSGEFVTFEELVDEVGRDAARFFMLMIAPETHIDFDLGLAKEKSQKNPVYYAQYAYVRVSSILKRANSKFGIRNLKLNLLNTTEDINLMRELARFPEIIEDVAADYGVERLTRYAHKLARTLHNLYEKERIIGEREDLARARLALVSGTKHIFENLFKILGITAPKRM